MCTTTRAPVPRRGGETSVLRVNGHDQQRLGARVEANGQVAGRLGAEVCHILGGLVG